MGGANRVIRPVFVSRNVQLGLQCIRMRTSWSGCPARPTTLVPGAIGEPRT